ncbi:MAG: hypothetical protein OXD31_11125 [Chloroflexi bacterium]|nr:hypothetical protein [Chloroflexota bacterium]
MAFGVSVNIRLSIIFEGSCLSVRYIQFNSASTAPPVSVFRHTRIANVVSVAVPSSEDIITSTMRLLCDKCDAVVSAASNLLLPNNGGGL